MDPTTTSPNSTSPSATASTADTASRAGDGAPDVAARIAQRTLAPRAVGYAGEVRRLLDAALEVMRRCGTTSRPRVADIVATAGLSNEAFYRHFPSKDALVTALLEDGTERLRGYLAHQMAKEATPERRVHRWVEGVLAQADGDVAGTTLAVLYNSGGIGEGAAGRHFASGPLATLLHEPLTALGSTRPELDASLVAHAVLGRLSDHLWQRTRPGSDEVGHVTARCLAAVRGNDE
ncbi:MAG TPA: TetR/AcrR family transcriptional regulator [Acidimicrobiales bacterium]|nr:TetR/AcrR family transcriptional regulator [Acidimicrobiales bacterium]